MKNNTIVVFAAYIFPHLGGIETYLNNLFREFGKTDYNILVVTSNWNEELNFEKKELYDIIRLPVYSVFKKRYPIFKKNKEYRELMNILNDYNINAIIVNTRFHLSSHIGADYAKKRNIPCFLIEHGSAYITVNNKILDIFANCYENLLTNKIKDKISGFYGVSERCNKWLKEFGIESSGIFYNAVDSDIYYEYKKFIKPNKKVIITYAGRILYEKGVENLIKAFLNINNNNCELLIAGDGNALDDLKKKYNKNNINFLGRLNHNEVIKLLAKTDIFCYPSMYPEGLPTSIIEAGLMKCAIIATDRGGTTEVINSKELGMIVLESVKDLTEKLDVLVNDKNKIETFKNNIHNRVMKKFIWKNTANTIIKEIKKYEK